MSSSVAESIMKNGVEAGITNTMVPAPIELRKKLAGVPPGCALYLVYGGGFGKEAAYSAWPVVADRPRELQQIRRTCRRHGWRCTYYIVEANQAP